MGASRFRKKPVVIEAFQMTEERRADNVDWPEWLNRAWNGEEGVRGSVWPEKVPHSNGEDRLVIGTLEGHHVVSWGDWIIQGVQGELYPCKPDIFAATYEPADDLHIVEGARTARALAQDGRRVVGVVTPAGRREGEDPADGET